MVELQDEVDVVTAEAEDVRSDLVGLSDMVADSVAMTPLTPAQPVPETGEAQDQPHRGKRARGILIMRPDGQSMLVVRGPQRAGAGLHLPGVVVGPGAPNQERRRVHGGRGRLRVGAVCWETWQA